MARSKHVHKFIQIGRKGYESKIWKCALPDCTWFVHMGLSHVMLGKTAICWGCDEMFVMDENAMKEDMPKCVDCRILFPIVEATKPEKTPEQQIKYEKEMREMYGSDWKNILGK